ncbi:hypothetical protein SCLCIDRAFT_1223272 [Scleroderma citrinum Foug A]|uniref:Uncharacterized protein n=1 Tax=Scleroderma citrinum Foug A TaxID=1036808 RepID=A0A0C2YTL4_9AGAM|nr:hypothetical protein SCLCIDRAFT_1223272 [Scleroderma citrinum Foug A]
METISYPVEEETGGGSGINYCVIAGPFHRGCHDRYLGDPSIAPPEIPVPLQRCKAAS